MSLKVKTKNIVELRDWNNLVQEAYGRPYSFQQQGDCRERRLFYFEVPVEMTDEQDAEENLESIPAVVNHRVRGVTFKSWLARDPKQPLDDGKEDKWSIELWWHRNFYPDINMVANDLHAKGLLEAGKYYINIDW